MIRVGMSLLKPSDSFMNTVAATSSRIAANNQIPYIQTTFRYELSGKKASIKLSSLRSAAGWLTLRALRSPLGPVARRGPEQAGGVVPGSRRHLYPADERVQS